MASPSCAGGADEVVDPRFSPGAPAPARPAPPSADPTMPASSAVAPLLEAEEQASNGVDVAVLDGEQALEKAGGHGRFQFWHVIAPLGITYMSVNIIVYSFTFIGSVPTFECLQAPVSGELSSAESLLYHDSRDSEPRRSAGILFSNVRGEDGLAGDQEEPPASEQATSPVQLVPRSGLESSASGTRGDSDDETEASRQHKLAQTEELRTMLRSSEFFTRVNTQGGNYKEAHRAKRYGGGHPFDKRKGSVFDVDGLPLPDRSKKLLAASTSSTSISTTTANNSTPASSPSFSAASTRLPSPGNSLPGSPAGLVKWPTADLHAEIDLAHLPDTAAALARTATTLPESRQVDSATPSVLQIFPRHLEVVPRKPTPLRRSISLESTTSGGSQESLGLATGGTTSPTSGAEDDVDVGGGRASATSVVPRGGAEGSSSSPPFLLRDEDAEGTRQVASEPRSAPRVRPFFATSATPGAGRDSSSLILGAGNGYHNEGAPAEMVDATHANEVDGYSALLFAPAVKLPRPPADRKRHPPRGPPSETLTSMSRGTHSHNSSPSNDSFAPCSRQQACALSASHRRQTSNYGWMTQLNLACAADAEVKAARFGQAYFIGFMLGGLLFPSLADVLGRKKVNLLTNAGCIACVLLLFLLSNTGEKQHTSEPKLFSYYGILATLFLYGLAIPGHYLVAFVHASELCDKHFRGAASSLIFVCENCDYYVCALWFLATYSPTYGPGFAFWFLFLACFRVFALGLVSTCTPESPKFFLSVREWAAARGVLAGIAAVNGKGAIASQARTSRATDRGRLSSQVDRSVSSSKVAPDTDVKHDMAAGGSEVESSSTAAGSASTEISSSSSCTSGCTTSGIAARSPAVEPADGAVEVVESPAAVEPSPAEARGPEPPEELLDIRRHGYVFVGEIDELRVNKDYSVTDLPPQSRSQGDLQDAALADDDRGHGVRQRLGQNYRVRIERRSDANAKPTTPARIIGKHPEQLPASVHTAAAEQVPTPALCPQSSRDSSSASASSAPADCGETAAEHVPCSSSNSNSCAAKFLRLDRNMQRRLLVLASLWFCTAVVNWSLQFMTPRLPGNVFANFVAIGVGKLVGYASCGPLSDRWGRKTLMMVMYILNGLFMFLYVCVLQFQRGPGLHLQHPVVSSSVSSNGQVLTTGLILLNVIANATAFGAIFIVTGELFPTEVRGTAFATSNFVGRVGSFLAPVLPELLPDEIFFFPFSGGKTENCLLLLSGICLASAAIMATLPETKGRTVG